MAVDRRGAIAGGAAVLALGAMPIRAEAPGRDLPALLGRHYAEYLRLNPRAAAATDPAVRGRLDGRSEAGRQARLAAARRWAAELGAFDPAGLSPALRRDYDTAAFTYGRYADLLGRYGFVDLNLRPNPYPVNQMAGAYYREPDGFARSRIATPADAAAWLERLAAFPSAIDGDTERVRVDATAGVVPPDFILARTLAQLADLRGTPPERLPMLAEPAAGARVPLDGAWARRLWDGPICTALDRQIAALEALKPRARADAGVWAQPDGEEWYAAALHANTTTPMPPEEMHALGLETVAAFTAELERMLAARGLTRGTLKDRLHALDADPRTAVPDDDTGRARVLAGARADLDRAFARLPRAFRTLPTRDVEIRRMATAIEAGSPGANYSGGSAAGGRPGVIAINLQHPREWPAWRLPTLIHHEGVPGHHLQAAVGRAAAARQPAYRQLARFSAYSEGWGLYGQRVADEIGVFDGDPLGRIGYLQSMLWRATRIVVDTGLHHKRWTRQQAIDWMVERSGEQVTSTEREIDRYCVLPGQACAFMYGQVRILAAREAARTRLGPRFDMGAFHDLLIDAGALPMPVLEAMVAAWDGATPA